MGSESTCPSQEVLEGWAQEVSWCRVVDGHGCGGVVGEHGGLWWGGDGKRGRGKGLEIHVVVSGAGGAFGLGMKSLMKRRQQWIEVL